jgi:hypothetical protein
LANANIAVCGRKAEREARPATSSFRSITVTKRTHVAPMHSADSVTFGAEIYSAGKTVI